MSAWDEVMRAVAVDGAIATGRAAVGSRACDRCRSPHEVDSGAAVSKGRYHRLCRRCWWALARADRPSVEGSTGVEWTDDELQVRVDAYADRGSA
jgi:hypothetical protein